MLPTLHDGDLLLVRACRRTEGFRPGDLALVHFLARPGRIMVKRVVEVRPHGLWVRGDNSAESDASEKYGLSEPLGRVVGRLWPRPGRLASRG